MKLKILPPPVELTEEEQDEIDEYALEIKLFEEFEMPLLLEEMEKFGGLKPEQTLNALSYIYWWGTPERRGVPAIPPARFIGEIGKILYDAIGDKKCTHEDVAYVLTHI